MQSEAGDDGKVRLLPGLGRQVDKMYRGIYKRLVPFDPSNP